ncbi:helix-turn-helix domain-containing protein [Phaeobacter sp. 11ANDIMAR09]|uniref:helix-turn-helix domain-containing protein n=1 Tax=Phaeobacter sp. 11ANDIMAR09 TaxID=1225647 RepID=UPI0006C8C634|nr:helix-turn-helix domain-containing protein [Phaeobacter sp. 11ANDIMAR09]KPD13458.1 transcriptional regulator [Phaeobacter sp. 11ANDIMAR09]
MSQASQISSYNLFGETAELADVLHVETIRSRSALHDWQLKAHRHARLHQLLFLTKGKGTADIDGKTQPVPTGSFVNIPRGVVHGYDFAPDTHGWVVTLTSDLLDHCIQASEGVRAPLEQPAVLPLPAALRALAEHLFDEYHRQDFARAQVLRSLAGALIGLASRAIFDADSANQHRTGNPLFTRFEALIERDFRKRRPLADYARDLAISPTHLNRIAHKSAGQSASQLINERMLREARRMLIYTDLSAAQIAYDLGFSDPAHFSRVFAKGTGTPPRLFRQQVGGER